MEESKNDSQASMIILRELVDSLKELSRSTKEQSAASSKHAEALSKGFSAMGNLSNAAAAAGQGNLQGAASSLSNAAVGIGSLLGPWGKVAGQGIGTAIEAVGAFGSIAESSDAYKYGRLRPALQLHDALTQYGDAGVKLTPKEINHLGMLYKSRNEAIMQNIQWAHGQGWQTSNHTNATMGVMNEMGKSWTSWMDGITNKLFVGGNDESQHRKQ